MAKQKESEEREEQMKKRFEELPNWMNPYKLELIQEEFYGMKKRKVHIPTDLSITFEERIENDERGHLKGKGKAEA